MNSTVVDEIYTLTLVFDESFKDEDGNEISVPVFLPYSYSSEELALHNAELAEAIYEESLVSWGVTRVGIDREIMPEDSGKRVH